MPDVTLEELELQAMEAADAEIAEKTITQMVKEDTVAVGKVKGEDPQKANSKYYADEEPTSITFSSAAAQVIETLLMYTMG